MTSETFLWHDFETFGADPRRDRACQFAAIRTNADLEVIAEPVVWYCQPTSDVLPVPEACLITGITPQIARERGMPEYEFANRIFELMSVPGTCSVGYNNFRFDDEVSRFLFWRNFIDPYAREYANGNSRFDLIDTMRLTHALRPEGIHWHRREDGTPGFRLADLAAANGFSIERAHDALADVENTLALARLVRERQPRLWQWSLRLRSRHRVEKMLEKREPLLHVSSRFPADQFCIAPVLPLFRHPEIKSQWLVWNLREDPEPFVDLDSELLSDLFWTSNQDLPDGYRRLPVKWVRTNRCPMLSPMTTLDQRAAERTGIDADATHAHAHTLAGTPEFLARLGTLFGDIPNGLPADAETALYDGFVSRADRGLAERLRSQSLEEKAGMLAIAGPFGDQRMNELLLHYIGRHAEHRLDSEQLAAWTAYRQRRLHDDPELASLRLAEYRAAISLLWQQRPDQRAILQALLDWLAEIGLTDPAENQTSVT